MRKRCQLCGGKLVNNVCVECGLDNSRNDSNYVTRKNDCEGEKLTHKHRETKDPYAGKTVIRDTVKTHAKASGGQTRKRIGGGLTVSVIVAIVLSGTVFGLLNEADRTPEYMVTEPHNFGQFDTSEFEEYDDSYDDWYEDPYDAVTRELSETGEVYEVSLTAGVYKGGVHLPEGSYRLTSEGGSGSITIDDDENCIYQSFSFQDNAESNDAVEDFRIYEGAIVEIQDRVTLHFYTENAQMDLTTMPNPNTQSGEFAESFTVGEDIPAGVYDMKCVKGSGMVEYYIDRGEYASYEGKLLGTGDSTFAEEYKNIVLPEGTEVDFDYMTLVLTPSSVIESEDYDSFYPAL